MMVMVVMMMKETVWADVVVVRSDVAERGNAGENEEMRKRRGTGEPSRAREEPIVDTA